MKLSSALLLVSCLAASAATDEQINKCFTAQPGGKLVVDARWAGAAESLRLNLRFETSDWNGRFRVEHLGAGDEPGFGNFAILHLI